MTFDFEARKVVADRAGVETDKPIDELAEIGVFAAAEPGERSTLQGPGNKSGIEKCVCGVRLDAAHFDVGNHGDVGFLFSRL